MRRVVLGLLGAMLLLHPLWAKALVIEDRQGSRVVIVTTDLVGFVREISESIGARVHKLTGIERERILFNSSHTHCGPLVSGFGPGAYNLPKEFQAAVDQYTREMEDKVVALIADACKTMQPAELAYSEDESDLGANRRRIKDGKWTGMGVNRDGPFERLVPVLKVSGQNGETLSLLFGYGCHNTTLGASVYRYNGDYAGFAQIAIQKAHPGATAMFTIGCGGDSNPVSWCGSRPEKAAEFGDSLAAAVDRALTKKLRPIKGPLRVAFGRVDLPFTKPLDVTELEQQRARGKGRVQARAEFLLEYAVKHGAPPTAYPCPVQVVRFGDDLSIIALPGETCVGYALRLRKEFEGQKLWVAGYSNEVFSYIPCKRVLAEGGYEATGAMISYGWPSPFKPEIEDRIVGLVKKLMAQCKQP